MRWSVESSRIGDLPGRAPLAIPALGVLAALWGEPRIGMGWVGAVAAMSAFLGLYAGCRRRSSLGRWALWVAWGGILWALASWTSSGRDDPASLASHRPVAVGGIVLSYGELRQDGREVARARLRWVEQGDRRRPFSGEVSIVLPTLAEGEPQESLVVGQGFEARGFLSRRLMESGDRAAGVPGRWGSWHLTIKSRRFFDIVAPEPGIWAAAARARRHVESCLARRLDDDSGAAALIRALILGDRALLPESWRRLTRVTGTVHLLAVSGLHLGLLAAFAYGLAAPLPRVLRLGFVVAAMIAGWALVGPEPAVTRAVLMGLWIVASLALKRAPRPLNALAGSTLVLLWLFPHWADDLGFRLSISATAALIIVMPWLAGRWISWLGSTDEAGADPWIRRSGLVRAGLWSAAASVSAQLATAPLLWPVTTLAHPWAPITDWLAIPWLTAVLAAAWTAVAGSTLISILGLSGDGLFVFVDVLSALPARLSTLPLHGVVVQVAPTWGTALVFGLSVTAGLALYRRLALLVAGILLTVPIWITCFDGSAVEAGRGDSEDRFQVVFLDVGQGDATLLLSPTSAILVDGGGRRYGDSAAWSLVPALSRLGVHRLDAVVATHDDVDHCRGLLHLIDYVPVAELWASPGWTGGCVADLQARIRHFRPMTRGMRTHLAGWDVTVHWPAMAQERDGNDSSLVLHVAAAGRSVLLTGDIEGPAERALVAAVGGHLPGAETLRADILKVSHHGSKTSTGERFLNAVRPRWAVISSGRNNRYGHPHPAVLDRLERHGVTVLRTDREGQVRFAWTARAPPSRQLPSDAAALAAWLGPAPSQGP